MFNNVVPRWSTEIFFVVFKSLHCQLAWCDHNYYDALMHCSTCLKLVKIKAYVRKRIRCKKLSQIKIHSHEVQ